MDSSQLPRTQTPEAQSLYTQSLTWFEAGRTDLAFAALKEAVKQCPDVSDYVLRLAHFQRESNLLDAARETLSEALLVLPEHGGIHYELGCLFHVAGQLDYALNYYRQALQLTPNLADGWHQLGRLLQQLERPEQATDAFEQAMLLAPDRPEFANSAGLNLYFLEKTEPARQCFEKALEHALPTKRARYLRNFSMALLQPPIAFEQALAHLEEACALSPDYSKEVCELGEHFFASRTYDVARSFFRICLPHVEEIDVLFLLHLRVAQCNERLCYFQEALDHYQQAIALRPDRWLIEVKAGLLLPLIYTSSEDVLQWRDRFAMALEGFLQRAESYVFPRTQQSLDLFSPPFLLAYQGFNHKVLLRYLSRFWQTILHLPHLPVPAISPGKKKRRIGLVSSFFFQHSVTGVYLGLVETWAQRENVELFFFSVGQLSQDQVTDHLKTLGSFCLFETGTSLNEMVHTLSEANLDILLYPEIGLEPLTYFLAHTRVAPVQAVLYGHPCTTGIETVDYFLSPACAETENNAAHYSENLVTLPGAPFVYHPEHVTGVFEREAYDLNDTDHFYFMPGALFKIHPETDALLAQILKQDPDAVICFIASPGTRWHGVLYERLQRVLGENIQRIRFLPYLEKGSFFEALKNADVVMDTLHFAAGNVAYQCFSLGVPLVTLPGQLMRSRTTAGLYELLELDDCTARNKSHWVELCLKMAKDKSWKQSIQARIQERSGRLFAIQDMLDTACDRIEALYASH